MAIPTTQGQIHCAELPESTEHAVETDYPGFDFTELWALCDGIPRLRIFE